MAVQHTDPSVLLYEGLEHTDFVTVRRRYNRRQMQGPAAWDRPPIPVRDWHLYLRRV